MKFTDNDNQAKFIPDWIIRKNLTSNEIWAIEAEGEDAELIRETEKAVLVAWFTEYGKVTMWCPKSVLKDFAEVKAEADAETDRMTSKMEAYDNLVNTAKELHVGVRSHMKVNTIVEKVKNAGKFEAIANLVKMGQRGYYVLAD